MAEIVIARVEALAAGGDGMALCGGMRVFTGMTAPGDLVRCRISEKHRGWARGELLEVIEPSPLRAAPACPLYGLCGGCSLQHLSYDAQGAEKKRILQESFRRIGGFEAPEPETVPSPPWEYRNRIQLHRAAGGRLGFKARRSDVIVPVEDCPVADPGIRAALKGKTLLPPAGKDRFCVYSRGDSLLREGGQSRGRTSLLGRELVLDAGVFFQSNGFLLEKLITRLGELAEGAERELPLGDMYCGVGTFTAFLGDAFPRTDLVEENPAALALARENARGEKAVFYALDAEDWVKNRALPKGPYGFMVLDPPRTGLSPAMRGWIVREGPPLLAYVSCDPATLARDSGEILRGGYDLTELVFYDFYPQTAHIESLAVFRRRGSPGALRSKNAPS
jgi:23S rRNA (uracil1939-C5)-methyltransferase